MDNYIEKMTASVFNPEDFTHEKFSVSAEWIFRRYKTYKETPVKQRLRKIAEDIHERFDTNKKLEDRIPSASVILKALNKMLKAKNTLALYEQFYTEVGESA
jgi:DNA helicase-2/ATP-dependent DNA helicase PcrA